MTGYDSIKNLEASIDGKVGLFIKDHQTGRKLFGHHENDVFE